MKKQKFKLEFPLNATSPNAVWNAVATSHGLKEWFADEVEESGSEFTFVWNKFPQTAEILHYKANSHVRFQWEDDRGSEYFFEFKLVSSELTKTWTLFVTDFCEPSDKEDTVLLWNQQIEKMKRNLGI